jgi:hypothetical protein
LRSVVVICLAIVATAAFGASSALAAKTHLYTGVSFGPDGASGFESFANVQSVAVDPSSGVVYVYDAGVGNLYKFDAAGEPVDFSARGPNVIDGQETSRRLELGLLATTTTTNAQASFPPAMTAPGTGLLPPHNSTATTATKEQR